MAILQTIITVIYYILIAYVAAILIWNLSKTRKWEQEVLYIIVLIPFLLRLFRLK
ncbi:MAG: hypothetical protein JSV41_06790 [Gemmatimonadota bacterium]|nr:MAG: hypothetical protein JSV41_06790 [Gemmatimonadota bacterium]